MRNLSARILFKSFGGKMKIFWTDVAIENFDQKYRHDISYENLFFNLLKKSRLFNHKLLNSDVWYTKKIWP